MARSVHACYPRLASGGSGPLAWVRWGSYHPLSPESSLETGQLGCLLAMACVRDEEAFRA